MAERLAEINVLNEEVRTCPKCDLATTRKRSVPGEGPLDAEIMFIGEGPGYNEDVQGRPFVGNAGTFLEELLASIGMRRDQVYITNVVKCRPPQNRDPAPDEIAACSPYLDRQIAILDPRLIVTLGRFSMARFFPGKTITRIHGQPKRENGRIIFPMMHPAAALHRPENRQLVEEDMLKIPGLLDEARRLQHLTQMAEPEAPPDPDEPQQLSLF